MIGSVLIVALLMVATGGAALIIGGENEAPCLPEYGSLTYSIRNNTQIHSLGSYGIEFQIDHGWYLSTVRWWYENVIDDYEGLPNGHGTGVGRYLDTVSINTSWGTKTVYRYFGFLSNDQDPGVSVQYLGVDSGLVYRTDLIRSDYHLEVKLTEANFSSIWKLDREGSSENAAYDLHENAARHLRDDWTFILGAGETYTLLEPTAGQDYLVSFNSSNTFFYSIGEADIWAMAQGQYFTYDEERSLIGNGSLNFVIEEGLTFICVGEHGEGTPRGVVNITIREE
jgi:hypothetical protein